MQKITHFTNSATRHGWDRMPFGMSRPHTDGPGPGPQNMRRPPHISNGGHHSPAVDSTVNLSFNVPFASNLPGPDVEDVIHSSPNALQKWVFPLGTPDATPIHKLPVHAGNVENLRRLCRQVSEAGAGRLEASVTSAEPKASQSLHRKAQGLVTNVCISGNSEIVHKMKARILNETPISLVSDDAARSIHLLGY